MDPDGNRLQNSCSLLLGNPNSKDPYLVVQVVKVIKK